MKGPDFNKYPFHVVLHFESKDDADHFIGGFMDGWGENIPWEIDWDGTNWERLAMIRRDEWDI